MTEPVAAFDHAFNRNDRQAAEPLVPGLLGTPHAVSVLTRLALLRRRAGDAGGALAAFDRAAALGGALPDWFHAERAGAHLDRRDYRAALADAEAGLAVKPVLGLTMATALLHLGQVEGARGRLVATIPLLDAGRAAALAGVCQHLLSVEDSPATRAVIAQAAARYPKAAEFAPLAPGRDRFVAAILAAPENEGAVFQWRDALGGPDAEVTARFAALQDAQAGLLPALALHLARRLGMDEFRRRYAGQIAAWHAGETHRCAAAVLEALCDFGVPDAAVLEAFRRQSPVGLRCFFLLREPALRVVFLEEAADMPGLGAVRAQCAALFGSITPDWAAYLDGARFASDTAGRIIRADERFAAFQDRVVAARDFPMTDPRTGVAADLFDSVKIHDRQVFSFRGDSLLWFHTAGNMNFAIGLHLVRENIVLRIDERGAPSKQAFYASDHHLAEISAIWLRRAVAQVDAYRAAAGAAAAHRGRARRVTALCGRAENPAHHIWNYLPPFERLHQAGMIGNLGRVIAPPTDYFGTLEGLYPELAGIPIDRIPEAGVIDPHPFDPGTITLQLGSSVIPAPLMARVVEWAGRTAPEATRGRIAALKGRHPIVWIGLRAGDKMWVRQVEGVAWIIDRVADLYPDALFLLDGFSLPDGAEGVPEKWQPAVAEITATAEAIIAAARPGAAIESLVGNRLSESVLWAQRADVYFAPMGSSQHKVGWYTGAPGLVYATPALARTEPAARQGAWEAEGMTLPHFLIGSVADPGRRRGPYDYRSHLENLDFAPEVAARRLVALLARGEMGG